jgi:hypothetical protein
MNTLSTLIFGDARLELDVIESLDSRVFSRMCDHSGRTVVTLSCKGLGAGHYFVDGDVLSTSVTLHKLHNDNLVFPSGKILTSYSLEGTVKEVKLRK